MEEPICHIEISQEDDEIVAKLQSDLGGIREFRSFTFEQVLKLIVNELQEELEFNSEPEAE
ncbi:MAG TPA: hypothetical protein ENK47_02260 [Euryarchaeota archaeon]|nr:MAG: hypothetical protein B6U90_04450 [Thermoplasmatales archaeon ex4484_6]RLF67585.1 MAG: hypothetical protein DRN57_05480 [Thermoplasmata archaeon]HHD15510.1 hypothetical protein [Euryarchaeota archaeon]